MRGYLIRGNEIWLYVFGTARWHGQKINGTGEFRRYTLRLDGWASLRSTAVANATCTAGSGKVATTAWAVTKPFRWPEGSKALRVNAAVTSGGALGIVLKPTSDSATVLPSATAIPVSANGVDLPVVWRGEASDVDAALRQLQGQSVQLRFELRNTELFSWWIES